MKKPLVNILEYPFVILHTLNSCGGEVFFYKKSPVNGETLDAELSMLPDNTKPADGQPMTCSKCKALVEQIHLVAFQLKPDYGDTPGSTLQ